MVEITNSQLKCFEECLEENKKLKLSIKGRDNLIKSLEIYIKKLEKQIFH